MAKHRGDDIFCLEGEWSADLRERVSVRPILELLDHLGVAGYIHRDVATTEELIHYVGKWRQKRYDSYKVLFLAMHGDAESLHLGRDDLTLEELGGVLEGACQGKVIYFGSCLTLKASEKSLTEFVRRTGARAVVGYRRSVLWLESAAFEVLLLDRLALGLRSDAIFNRLAKEHGLFAKSLGLVVATRAKVHKVPLRQARTNIPPVDI